MIMIAATPPPTAPPMTAPLLDPEPDFDLPVDVGITLVAVRDDVVVYFLVK